MALDFPASPTNGQLDPSGQWIYNSSKLAWQSVPLTQGKTVTSPTPPSSPQNGDQWFNTNDGTLYIYYTDANTSQWVESRAPITADGYQSPNYVLNGAFDINQRNMTATNLTTDQYTLDRWFLSLYGSGQPVQVTRETDGSSVIPHGQYARLRIASNNATNVFFSQSFDNNELRQFRGKTMTLSFWYSSSTPEFTAEARWGTFVSERFMYTGNGSRIASTACPTSAGWVRKSLTFTVPPNAEGFCIMFSATNITNALAAVFQLAGVQLEEGSVATSFRRNANSIQGELAACQRYYWRYTQDQSFQLMGLGSNWSGGEVVFTLKLPVTMRATPSASISDIGGVYWLANNTNYSGASSFSQRTTKETWGFAATLTSPINVPLIFRPPLNSYMEASAEL